MKIDENLTRSSSYLLNDLKNFNEIFRKFLSYDKVEPYPLSRKLIVGKTTCGGQIDPSLLNVET